MKNKDILSKIKEKVFDDKKVELAQNAEEIIKKDEEKKNEKTALNNTLYDVVKNDKNEMFIIKINYNLDTKKAEIEEALPFNNKVVTNSVNIGKANLEKVYEVTKRLKKRSI